MAALNVSVEEYTTPDPIVASHNLLVDELVELLEKNRIRHLPVVDEDSKVIGIISERDLRLVAGLDLVSHQHVRAADIMTPDPVTMVASTPLDEVAFAMSDMKIGSVLINDEEGNFLGIFTASDALNALVELIRS